MAGPIAGLVPVENDPSLPILNVGCPVANGSKADGPRHNSETTLMTPTGNVAPITILLSSACG
jgi:hypothetical protein